MKKNNIQLGWFNTWVGLVWIIMFIPCLLYFLNYNLFLNTRSSKEVVTEYKVNINDNKSRMKIETDKSTFYYYNDIFFDTIIAEFKTANYIEIWYNKESRVVRDIRINNSHFIIPKTKLEIRLYLFALLLSGLMLILSITLIVKTKGWGSYDLLEKYPEGLWKKILSHYDWHRR